jgi:hypothetical protein
MQPYRYTQWLLLSPSGSGYNIACWSEGRRHTEGDGEVEDEATPKHAGDGLDGHVEGICWCDLFWGGLRAGIALVDGKLAVG